MLSRGAAALASVLVVLTAAPALGQQVSPSRLTEPLTGRELYQRDCAFCHGAAGQGVERRGPPLADVGQASAFYWVSTGRMPIDEPDERPQRQTPAYSDEEVGRVVAFVARLGDGPPVPDVDASAGSVAEGGELFRQHCAACHGFGGEGGAMAEGVTAPRTAPATPEQAAAAIRLGPGAMPAFGDDVIDDRGMDSLVAYLAELEDPERRGGLEVPGGWGSFGEAAIAWIFGVAVIVLVCRWVGARGPS